ncbi:twin-arginine translocase subunit TatB [Roseateles aquatilis]|uniref:Sec-independent protein translocase protein TatB n=1 Tax=Roseateles aquatilis TaxID=431061 RepID=A0A246JM64_9BURK|nr:Sec-independent protein translocase protein TatB [Roseateles aquatilis]OWQ93675.1 twin-arginine translocase subunit TatB [Roseateles aquatilis]
MVDFGFDKLALIGAVALVVLGPERLPRVARTVGHLLGKAQRYVSDVKAEVNRSIELEELQKMKGQFETAVSDVHSSVRQEMDSASQSLQSTWSDLSIDGTAPDGTIGGASGPVPVYAHPKKNWRVKRGATPVWYKQRQGVRRHAQSGAARVARFRPPGRA